MIEVLVPHQITKQEAHRHAPARRAAVLYVREDEIRRALTSAPPEDDLGPRVLIQRLVQARVSVEDDYIGHTSPASLAPDVAGVEISRAL